MINYQFSEKILLISIYICVGQAFLEFLGVFQSNIINPTNVLEITFFLLCAYNFRPENVKLAITSLILFIAGISLILLSRTVEVPYFESIRAYKWLFFLSALIVIKKELQLSDAFVRKIYLTLLFSISASYIIQTVLNGLDSRPTLIIENNYECALLIGLFVVNISNANLSLSRKNLTVNAVLVLTILMSQSRSALITLVLVALVIFLKSENSKKRIFPGIILVIGCVSLVIYTFNNRGTSLGNLDRFRFLNLFLGEFEAKSNISKFFGNWVIQPLNPEVCIQLRFYSSLQDNEILGSCYSVVFHSYLIRAVHDFGLLGTILIFFSYGKFLYSRLEKNAATCLFFIAVTNSLSVSGINNVYVVLPMMIALLSNSSSFSVVNSKPFPYRQ